MNYFVIFVVKYFHDFYFASILIDFLHSSKLLQVKIALFNIYRVCFAFAVTNKTGE